MKERDYVTEIYEAALEWRMSRNKESTYKDRQDHWIKTQNLIQIIDKHMEELNDRKNA